jgi:hypothetical protein
MARFFLGFVPSQGPSPRPEIPSPAVFARYVLARVAPVGLSFRARSVPLRSAAEAVVRELSREGQRVAVQPKLYRRGAS